MTKAELESKHLSDLHALAAEAGVERFRMLTRAELIAKLSDGDGDGGGGRGNGEASGAREPREPREQRERSASSRRRRSRGGRGRSRGGREGESSDEVSGRGDKLREEALGREPEQDVAATEPTPAPAPTPAAPAPAAPAGEPERPRRRRRRRFGRRKEGVTIQDLLLPAEAGRQAVLAAESRAACTSLLRGVAGDLAGDSKGPDPVILLIDPTPEELADWKREAPQAEIVAAGQARHANDALAQAASRAGSGEDVILLVDSLTRLAGDDFGDTDTAKEFFDAGRAQGAAGGGSLTVVAAIERQAG